MEPTYTLDPLNSKQIPSKLHNVNVQMNNTRMYSENYVHVVGGARIFTLCSMQCGQSELQIMLIS